MSNSADQANTTLRPASMDSTSTKLTIMRTKTQYIHTDYILNKKTTRKNVNHKKFIKIP